MIYIQFRVILLLMAADWHDKAVAVEVRETPTAVTRESTIQRCKRMCERLKHAYERYTAFMHKDTGGQTFR